MQGLGYSPMTPGSSSAASPYQPVAAGAGRDTQDMLGSQDWYSPDIEVFIKDSHDDVGLCGQTGVVRGVTPGMCSVFLHEEERWVYRIPCSVYSLYLYLPFPFMSGAMIFTSEL